MNNSFLMDLVWIVGSLGNKLSLLNWFFIQVCLYMEENELVHYLRSMRQVHSTMSIMH